MPTHPSPGPSQARATLREVARLSGVSQKTAARALNGEDHVRPETRQKVLAAASSLRFRPNRLARELRQGAQTQAVGFVTGGLENPFYAQVAAGLERVLRDQGLELIIASTADDPDHEEVVVQTMLERRVQALVITPASADQSYLEGERQFGTPIVFVDRPGESALSDSVLIDNRGGVRTAVRSLAAHGHRRIAVIADRQDLFTARERLLAFSEVIAEVPEITGVIRSDVHDAETAYRATCELLAVSDDLPTAILTLNNRISLGALKALYEARTDTAIIGFDDFDLAEVLGISVVAYDAGELGRRAGELALRRMRDGGGPPERVTLGTRLVQRGSGERPWQARRHTPDALDTCSWVFSSTETP